MEGLVEPGRVRLDLSVAVVVVCVADRVRGPSAGGAFSLPGTARLERVFIVSTITEVHALGKGEMG